MQTYEILVKERSVLPNSADMMTPLRVKQSVLYNAPAPTAITDAEIHAITSQSGYPDGDSVSY